MNEADKGKENRKSGVLYIKKYVSVENEQSLMILHNDCSDGV